MPGVGWAIGAQVSIFTAFVVSMVGTGIGLYYILRAVKNLLPEGESRPVGFLRAKVRLKRSPEHEPRALLPSWSSQ